MTVPPTLPARALEIRLAPGAGPLPDLPGPELAGPIRRVTALIPADDPARPAALAPLLAALPGLGALGFRLAGTPDPDRAAAFAEALAGLARGRGLPGTADILLDDRAVFGDLLFGAARGGDRGSLPGALAAAEALAAAGLAVRWLVPLRAPLVFRLETLVSLAREHGITVLPVLPAMLGDPDRLGDDVRLFARDFLLWRILGEEAESFAPATLAWFAALLAALDAPEGPAAEPVLVLGDGPPRREDRPGAALLAAAPLPGAEGAPGRSALARLRTKLADLAEVAGGGLAGHLAATRAPAPRPEAAGTPIPRALLIGAYGGEHIGDAAILGGVLGRIHVRHGTRRAVLMSQRPDHTRHLVAMLETPVEVEVRDYSDFAAIRAAVAETDGVVFAGGPLTDIPKQLVRHLYAAARARRAGKPFVMEGIGPGTFPRRPSEITARRLVLLADRIAIRTRDDAGRPVIRGLPVEIGRDPAFDYLATRGPVLTRLLPGEDSEVAALLDGTAGRLRIGLNVRPIGHFFTAAPPGEDPLAYTRAVEDRFEREFARGLAAFAAAVEARGGPPPAFVYFPMNAVQFGMSDLRSAFRILRHLPPALDVRIWEADASLDGVVALIRQLHVVVSMRFHATIFALSQGCPVIGVDYRIGKRDKVAAVLADAGQGEHCRRIDELTGDWLAAELALLAPQDPALA